MHGATESAIAASRTVSSLGSGGDDQATAASGRLWAGIAPAEVKAGDNAD